MGKKTSWNKGLTKETNDGVRRSAEAKIGKKRIDLLYRNLHDNPMKKPEIAKKMSDSSKGKIVWNKGKKLGKQSPELILKRTEGRRGYKNTKEHNRRIKKARAKQILPVKDTSIEVKIQNFLKELGIEFFTHQYIKIEHGYQCDILIPSMNLVIECDGDYWHKYPIGNDLDHIRTSELIKKGFKVLRLWEFEIKAMELNEFEGRLNGLQ